MEIFFASLIKLIIIFFGGGSLTLLAIWIGGEVSLLVRDFMVHESKELANERLRITKKQKINSECSLYQISSSKGEVIKIYSSKKGMQVLKV